MSTINYGEVDEQLWERYLTDLQQLSLDNEGVKVFPSLSDYKVWLSDQDLDEPEYE